MPAYSPSATSGIDGSQCDWFFNAAQTSTYRRATFETTNAWDMTAPRRFFLPVLTCHPSLLHRDKMPVATYTPRLTRRKRRVLWNLAYTLNLNCAALRSDCETMMKQAFGTAFRVA